MDQNTEQLLREMAAKLGTTVEYLWPKIVGYTKMQAIMNVSLSVFFLLMIPPLLLMMRKMYRSADNFGAYSAKRDGRMAAAFTCLIASIIIFVISLLTLSTEIPVIYYPEFTAIKTLMGK